MIVLVLVVVVVVIAAAAWSSDDGCRHHHMATVAVIVKVILVISVFNLNVVVVFVVCWFLICRVVERSNRVEGLCGWVLFVHRVGVSLRVWACWRHRTEEERIEGTIVAVCGNVLCCDVSCIGGGGAGGDGGIGDMDVDSGGESSKSWGSGGVWRTLTQKSSRTLKSSQRGAGHKKIGLTSTHALSCLGFAVFEAASTSLGGAKSLQFGGAIVSPFFSGTAHHLPSRWCCFFLSLSGGAVSHSPFLGGVHHLVSELQLLLCHVSLFHCSVTCGCKDILYQME